jgi:hypothetical protein
MSIVLSDRIGVDCDVFLDDIIVYSKTIEQHLEKLRRVLDKLGKAG